MIRKHARNDVDHPPGQIVNPVGKPQQEEAPQELVHISQEMGMYDEMLEIPLRHFEKSLIKELSEYEELLKRNNSENSR